MLIEAFVEQVRKNPWNIAVRTKEKEMTYDSLNKQANYIANQIIDKCRYIKSENGDYVAALLFEHGTDMIVGTLGALKANVIYIPFDPAYPENRLLYMLRDSQAHLIVTNSNNYELAKKLAIQVNNVIKVLNIDEAEQSLITEDQHRKSSGDRIAYILYTSGSTGRPKGVIQTHKNVLHFARSYINRIDIKENDRMTLFSAFSHDAAIVDIFSGLLSGATLYPLNVRQQINIEDLSRWLSEEEITIWHSVPTLYRYFVSTLTDRNKFSKLRYVVLGGENVLKQDVVKFREIFKDTVLVNLYGQSESSINSLQFIAPDTKFEGINLGEPIEGVNILVLSKKGKKAAPLREGEIVVASPYLALGYWNETEKTENAFINDPNFGRIYKTGDLGWFTANGKLEYLGRTDFQVKIRGFRVELEEVENSLLKHSLIKEAVVLGKDDINNEKILHAYIASDKAIAVKEIRNYLYEELPDYMVPSYFTLLDKMPLTPSGKIDRKALEDIRENIISEAEYEEPKTETEKKLHDIWRTVLGVERIGINDSFFELGGHSLKAISLIAKIHKELNVEIPLREIFINPTIKGISEFIKGLKESVYASIEKVEEKKYYEVSSAQKRLYTLQQFDLDSTAYNMPGVLEIEGKLDKERLDEAFKKLIVRHEVLRTSFEIEEEEIIQKIYKEVEFELEYTEASSDNELYAKDIEGIVKKFIRPFDLSKAPLLRVGLIKVQSEKYILMYDMHHIISDGTTVSILTKEFAMLYSGKGLPELRIQYKDYAAWQNSMMKKEKIKDQEQYWLEEFKGEIPVLNLPTDYPRPSIQSTKGDKYRFEIGKDLLGEIKGLSNQKGITVFTTLLGILSIVLSKYSGQEDIIIGTVTAGRTNVDIESLAGVLINSIAFRCMPKSGNPVGEYLSELSEKVIKAYENQGYQIEELIEKLNLKRDTSRSALFDVMIILQNYERGIIETESMGLKVKPYSAKNMVSDYDLTLYINETDSTFIIDIQYCTALFKENTIKRFAEHFINAAHQVCSLAEAKISEIEIVIAEEKKMLLHEFNKTKAEYPKGKTIHELFEEQVEKTPDNIAVVYKDSELTYRQLNQRANNIAKLLRKRGIGSDKIVGIMVERSLEMIVGIIGILKAGGAYLPIDPEYPEDRIKYMLEDSGVGILLTQEHLRNRCAYTGEIIRVDDERIYEGEISNPEKVNKSYDLAYVIYTSGTTGKPKGVMVQHDSYVNISFGWKSDYQLDRFEVRLLQIASYSFDLFAGDFSRSLLNGGTMVICPNEDKADVQELYNLIMKHNINILESTPPLVIPLMEHLYTNALYTGMLKIIILSGDSCSVEDYRRLKERFGSAIRIINNYGVAEATIDSCFYEDDIEEIDAIRNVPIGKPMQNTKFYVLDKYKKLLPTGIYGELYIGGDGLARGYFNRPELTAEKFVPNPFETGERLYKTGDLVRWLPDGNIEFLGRIDNQVKIRGFRIELEEIENRLLRCEGIKEAVVAAKEKSGNGYLCAYIIAGKELKAGELREYLGKELPDYMIPSYFMQLEKMPLNANGKIDRKALPEVNGKIETGAEYEAPRNKTEEKLVGIWQEVLKVDRVGINDNFFELGGHSLNIVQAVSRINRELNINLKTADIFLNLTIKKLAQYIYDSESQFDDLKHVVKLNHSVSPKSIFILHGLDGDIYYYKDLAGLLEKNCKVYGIQAKGLTNQEEMHQTCSEMLSDYVKEIKRVKKDGPYIIVGYCIGDMLAYEIVRMLEDRSENVEKLILLDANAFMSDKYVKLLTIKESLRKPVDQMLYLINNARDEVAAASEESQISKVIGCREPDTDKEKIKDHIGEIMKKYSPKRLIRTPTYIIKAKENDDPRISKECWSKMVRNRVVLTEIPGDHKSILKYPYVNRLAEVIKNILKER